LTASVERVKPKLRGVFHELGFYGALGVGIPLVLTAHDACARTAAAISAVASQSVSERARSITAQTGSRLFGLGSRVSIMPASTS
jgi:hypothetical protein